MGNETLEIIEMVKNNRITAEEGAKLIEALKQKNIALLRESKKDLDLLRSVYGK